MDKIKVTWQVTRHFGNEDVTLTLEGESVFGSTLIDTDLLQGKAQEIFAHYINSYVPKGMANPMGGAKKEEEIIPADKLEVKVEKGKRLFKVYGGKYSKHGVPFYDEHIRMGAVQPEDIPDVGWDLRGKYNMIVQLEGGQPKRVLKLVKVV